MEIKSKYIFPNVLDATPEGIVTVGGNLSPEVLVSAYMQGIYPWYSDDQPILWWSPNPRAIIPIDDFYVGKTLRKVLNKKAYSVTFDADFYSVIKACSIRPDGTDSGWITSDMINAYIRLFELGVAHSVEVWSEGLLCGGLYGVAIKGVFAGESMFYRLPNASKVALYYLVKHLKEKGFSLLDCQMVTDVTKSIGAIEISRDEYLSLLKDALEIEPCF